MSPIKINDLKIRKLSQETGNDCNRTILIESSNRDTLSDTGALTVNPVIAIGLEGLTSDLVGDLNQRPLTALAINGVLHSST